MLRRVTRTFVWVVLLALGCGGGGASCGGCGGCAMEPIPGGFPAEHRAPNAMRAKLSADALRFIEGQVQTLITQQMGQLAFPVPCTDASQRFTVGTPPFAVTTTVKIHACDLNENGACDPADESDALRVDEPGHGVLCSAAVSIAGLRLLPGQMQNGDVDIAAAVDLKVNTGRIPLRFDITDCGCSLEFDSDRNSPPTIPVRVHLALKTNRQNQILSWDLTGIDDIAGGVDSSELQVARVGSGSICRLVCDVSNVDFLKEMLFGQLEGMIYEQLRGAVDGARCRPCDADGSCPAGSTCHEDLCYRRYAPTDNPATDVRDCVENPLGMEGRMDLGAALSGFGGGSSGAKLDVSILAGGLDPDGKPSAKAQTGGVVVGLMGGTVAPARAACVPMQRWQARPPVAPLDFDAEARTPALNGTSLTGYHMGFSLSDDYLDRAAFEAWGAGALCIDLPTEAVGGILSTGLFKTFLGSLDLLTHKQDSPMLVSLRPRNPPQIRIGKGSTKPGPNGTRLPDDALLTIEMKDLNVDFYALIEERQVRLFTLITDLSLPLALEFDAQAKTVTPVLGGLETLLTNVRAANNELLAEDPDSLVSVLSSIIGLAGPALSGGLGPIEMPAMQGMELQVLDARGAARRAAGDHDYLAMFIKLSLAPAAPLSQRFDTSAKLASLEMPALDALRFEGARPTAIIDASGLGNLPIGFKGFEYSWRVDGDLWRPWEASPRLAIAAPQLVLEGRHVVEVRAREAGVMESADLTPASVVVRVDYTAPELSLVPDAELGAVRVVARDRVATPEELTMRVRTTGDWSAATALRDLPFAELDGDVLEVEVRDPAGFSTTARLGAELTLTDAPARTTRTATADAQGGCTQVPAALGALLGLAALARRRGRRT